jgi:hypothetical protein
MRGEVASEVGVSSERRRGPASYWLIVEQDFARKMLTLCPGPRGEILPVFGSEEDADAFLAPLGAFGAAFAAEAMTAEDLTSLLSASHFGVGTVALDPAPGMETGAAVLGFISMDREGFVEKLREEGRPGIAGRGVWSGPGPARLALAPGGCSVSAARQPQHSIRRRRNRGTRR